MVSGSNTGIVSHTFSCETDEKQKWAEQQKAAATKTQLQGEMVGLLLKTMWLCRSLLQVIAWTWFCRRTYCTLLLVTWLIVTVIQFRQGMVENGSLGGGGGVGGGGGRGGEWLYKAEHSLVVPLIKVQDFQCTDDYQWMPCWLKQFHVTSAKWTGKGAFPPFVWAFH